MENKSEKSDRRIIKTRRAIKNAFIKLLTEKDFNQITVKDIADEADIDRKTLYNHYTGIYEIRDELENDLLALLNQAIAELDFEKNVKNPRRIFEILTDILSTNLELCDYLMKINAHSQMLNKISGLMRDRLKDAMAGTKILPESEIDLCADFVVSGMLSVFQSWFNSDRSRPIEEISGKVGNLVLYGLGGMADKSRK